MNIIIIVQNPFYNLFETFYEEASKDPFFKITFVLLPLGHPEIYTLEELKDYFDKKKVPYVVGLSEKLKKPVDILKLEPDLVIYQTPYDGYRPYALTHAGRIGQHVPISHISYGTTFIEYDQVHSNLIKDNIFQKICWKIFIENSLVEQQMNKIVTNKYKTIGYLKCDKYLNSSNCKDEKTKPKNDLFHIVWKPRWTATLGKSNLMRYIFFFQTFLQKHPNVKLTLYGHPLLKNAVTMKTNIATEHAWNEIEIFYNQQPNAEIETSGDFLEKIWSADLFIGDFSSTLAEFYLTGKPIIYTPVDVTLSELGREMEKGMYVANNAEDLTTLIAQLIEGDDPLDVERQKQKEYISTPLPGATIAQGFCNYLKKQFLNKDSDYWQHRKGIENGEVKLTLKKDNYHMQHSQTKLYKHIVYKRLQLIASKAIPENLRQKIIRFLNLEQ